MNLELSKEWKDEDLGYGFHPCGLRYFNAQKNKVVARDFDINTRYQKVIALGTELGYFLENPKRIQYKNLELEEFITTIYFNRDGKQ